MAWINPRYRELTGQEPPQPFAVTQAERQEAPTESGERLAALPRQSRGKPPEELRVHLCEYQGHAYVSIRVWMQNESTGHWWPVRGKGVSVRIKECHDVADALKQAVSLSGGLTDQPPPRKSRPSRPTTRPTPNVTPQNGDEFDEFTEGY